MRQASSAHTTTAPAGESIPTRRAALALAAGTAVSAIAIATKAAKGSPAAALSPDPIHAAIARHSAALSNFIASVAEIGNLEEVTPREQSAWFWTADDREPPPNHSCSPAWIEAQLSNRAASEAEEEAALALITTSPATIAGLAALVRYVVNVYDGGDTIAELDDDENPVPIMAGDYFLFMLHRHVADALEAFAVA